MKNHLSGLLPKVHLWADVFFFNMSFLLAYLFRFEDAKNFPESHYINLMLVANLVWIFTIHV
ncbi:MAG TPA: sugar transferase, partial [Dyadobacter sp.]|nr:sugar transferase [Dyadobacter sp.]